MTDPDENWEPGDPLCVRWGLGCARAMISVVTEEDEGDAAASWSPERSWY